LNREQEPKPRAEFKAFVIPEKTMWDKYLEAEEDESEEIAEDECGLVRSLQTKEKAVFPQKRRPTAVVCVPLFNVFFFPHLASFPSFVR
jgi:hypothetical protein